MTIPKTHIIEVTPTWSKIDQEKISYEELRDFFVKETGRDDKLINYSKLEKKFGKKRAYEFHERGLIYEPIRGKAKLI